MEAANRRRDLAFAESLYEEGMEAGFLDPVGLDLAAADLLGSTTHISVLDAEGNCASVTCSNGSGSGVLVPGTGVILNNMLGEEDLNPAGFHLIAPGRRVPSMMAPTVVLRDGEIVLALGSAGSNRIRSAILQTVVRAVEQGFPVAAAVEAPRLHFEQGVVQAEPGIDEAALARIEARGVPVAALARDQPLLRRRPGGRPRPAQRRAQRRRRPPPRRRRRLRCVTMAGPESTSRPRGCSTGSRARRARRGWTCSSGSLAKGCRWRSCGRRSPPGGWPCCRSSGRSPATAPATRPAKSPRSSGVDLELLRRFSAALGVPYTDPDEPRGTEADLEAARRMKAFLDAGLPEDGMLQVARTIGMGTARIAEANRELVIRTLTQPGDSERDVALRFAAAAEAMMPLVGPTVVYALQANMLEQIRRDVIAAADLASGAIGGTVDLTVCFADLVEFTRLGEEIAGRGAGPGRRPAGGDGERRRRAAGAAGEDDRRRGDARLHRGRADARAPRWR